MARHGGREARKRQFNSILIQIAAAGSWMAIKRATLSLSCYASERNGTVAVVRLAHLLERERSFPFPLLLVMVMARRSLAARKLVGANLSRDAMRLSPQQVRSARVPAAHASLRVWERRHSAAQSLDAISATRALIAPNSNSNSNSTQIISSHRVEFLNIQILRQTRPIELNRVDLN